MPIPAKTVGQTYTLTTTDPVDTGHEACERALRPGARTLLVRLDPRRQRVNAYVAGRDVRPSDTEDLLCGPQDTPAVDEDQALHVTMVAAAETAAHAFHQMVREILYRKEQDEREREAEGREARRIRIREETPEHTG